MGYRFCIALVPAYLSNHIFYQDPSCHLAFAHARSAAWDDFLSLFLVLTPTSMLWGSLRELLSIFLARTCCPPFHSHSTVDLSSTAFLTIVILFLLCALWLMAIFPTVLKTPQGRGPGLLLFTTSGCPSAQGKPGKQPTMTRTSGANMWGLPCARHSSQCFTWNNTVFTNFVR